jgi:hypothetical protein
MTNRRHVRRRRRSHFRRTIVVAVSSTFLLYAGLIVRQWQRQPNRAPTSHSNAPSPAIQPAVLRVSGRPVYPLSVIPGGAYSAPELVVALESDPVAASHYSVFQRAQLRTERSPFTEPVYVSYRRYNRIFWTRRALLLHEGETLLTDGVSYARARCGNRISLAPQQPVAEVEPLADTLDTPAIVEEDPLLQAAIEFEKPFMIVSEDFASPVDLSSPPVRSAASRRASPTDFAPALPTEGMPAEFFTGPNPFRVGFRSTTSFAYAPQPPPAEVFPTFTFASAAFPSNSALVRYPILTIKPADFEVVDTPAERESPAVPEPSTFLLLGATVVVLAFTVVWRRAKRSPDLSTDPQLTTRN